MRTLPTTLGLCACLAPLAAQGEAPEAFAARAQKVHGVIDADTTWRGALLVDGDITVKETAVLTIVPGTELRMAAGDFTKGGFRSDQVEFRIEGRLRVQGSDTEPVVFRPLAPLDKAAENAWHGIVLAPAESVKAATQITGAVFHKAFAAIQAPRSGPQIRRSVFLDCKVGIEAGSAYRDASTNGVEPGNASPVVQYCRFARCKTGVYVEHHGSPDLRNCVFYSCRTAVGNLRPGITSTLEDPGSIVERCAFLHNRVGVVGHALIQASIFLGNQEAVRLSRAHMRYSTEIDHVAMGANLFHENRSLVSGDTGLDNNPIYGDPRFAGPLEDLAKPGPALPACLALGPGSAATKRAPDGGDLGPLATDGGVHAKTSWEPQGEVVGEVYLLPGSPESREDGRLSRARPRAGRTSGDSWWIRAPMGGDGVIALGGMLPATAKVCWVAVPLRASRGARNQLEINGDVDQLALYINGKAIPVETSRRRFGVAGLVVDLAEARGSANLVMKCRFWGPRPRLGIAAGEGLRGKAPGKSGSASLSIKTARVSKREGRRFIALNTSSKLSWADHRRGGLFKIQDQQGEALPQGLLELRVVGLRKLEIHGLREEWTGPFQLELSGLRDPEGKTYGEVRVEAK